MIAALAAAAVWHFRHPAPTDFKTVKVTQRDLQQNVLATGQLDAVRKVDVGAQVSGQLEKLYVEIGDKVKKGQLLGVIDPQQAQNSIREGEATLRELHAQLLQAQAEQQLAAVTLQRNQALARLQAVSRQDLDQAATQLAVKKAQLPVAGSVAASDAFFPFRDGLDVLARAGVTAVVQPGGSKRDDEVIAAADEQGVAMVFTGMRHFRH